MNEHLLVSLTSILILGVGAQWLAWRLGLPSILLLLLAGFVAGPVTGIIDPDHLFGSLIFPFVSIAVAIILFEGGMSLQLAELQGTGHVVRNLVTVGALITWLICSAAAMLILDFPLPLAALLGAILVVTGPTVIGPLLRVVRPSGQVQAVLKWEGIVIDPVGATLAVLVFGAILAGEFQSAAAEVLEGVARTVLDGGALGALGAAVVILVLRRYLVPDFLQGPVVLMVVVSVFTTANLLQEEAGLLAVTVMGIILGNQPFVIVKHILDFKENLRTLLIGTLFVLLTARLNLDDLMAIGIDGLIFLGVVMLVARPVSVFLCTIGSDLNWRERVFLCWMAPRGVVAASVSSLFALEMAEAGIAGANLLAPATFLVILGTVPIYSLTAVPVARWLRVSRPNPQGLLNVGAHPLARVIGKALFDRGYEVIMVDTNHINIEKSRALGLPTFHGSAFDEDLREDIVLAGVGRMLAMTANDEVNTLAALEWAEVFGRANVFQLIPHGDTHEHSRTTAPRFLRGRPLFALGMHYTYLMQRINAGATIDAISVAETQERIRSPGSRGMPTIPLFVITEDGELMVVTAEQTAALPRSSRLVICLTSDSEETASDTFELL